MYTEKYFEAFSDGIKNATYSMSNVETHYDIFYKNLTALTKQVQKVSGRIFFFGNGASASFANHMALDWSKNGGVLAQSLSDSAFLTALANDYSYEDAFKEFAKINKLSNQDIVVTISSSGNSPNILKVLDYSKEVGAISIALSGLKPDNKSINKADFSVYFPFKTYGMVECAHQLYLHLWLDGYMNVQDWDREDTQNMNIKEFKL